MKKKIIPNSTKILLNVAKQLCYKKSKLMSLTSTYSSDVLTYFNVKNSDKIPFLKN